jgi:hypothetical protein
MAGMSILDDAIREHLELKRAHGADESELKKLEDEAFGPPQRPDQIDPFAEAPTEFMGVPEAEAAASEEGGRRMPNIADLQEAPEAPKAEAAATEAPVEEQQPASEQAIPDPAEALASDAETEAPAEPEEANQGPNTQERHAIADQPTEFFDVQSAMDSEPETASEPRSPSDEDLADAEADAPRLTPVEEPLVDEDDDDDFFSEQRLSDELNRALEAPVTEEQAVEESALPAEPAAPEAENEPTRTAKPAADADAEDGDEHEDVLEDTPDFLEDAPEDDNLWFEQRPPKDFDFDD